MSDDTVERCDQCGFDASRWDRRDTINTILELGPLVALSIDGADDGLMQRRPDDVTWSIAEYIDHCATTVELINLGVGLALEQSGLDIGHMEPPVFEPEAKAVDVAAAQLRLRDHALELCDGLRGLAPEEWAHYLVADDRKVSIDRASRHCVHDVLHHLDDIAGIRARLGDAAPAMSGVVAQISRSGGGVPKTAVERAVIDHRGVVGDAHTARQHHGRPWQALCLFSAEAIEALQHEGHPIAAGSAGENLTIRGLDWGALRQGLVLDAGTVRMRLTAPAVPCTKNSRWFSDGDFQRLAYDRDPAGTRWYASVIRPGTISAGDPITLQSPGSASSALSAFA